MSKQLTRFVSTAAAAALPSPAFSAGVSLPHYLQQTYWWAYLDPCAVRLFERQWLVNAILWGNYRRLQDAALEELQPNTHLKVLQIACVYGDLTERLARRLGPGGTLDVIDVAPVQLENLRRKLRGNRRVTLRHEDSGSLACASGSYDCVVVFFLLHEQPESARVRTVHEALRAVRPGGKVVFVDYHRPRLRNPFRYVMVPVLRALEPYAMDLWQRDIHEWLPQHVQSRNVKKQTYFGDLYQKVVVTV